MFPTLGRFVHRRRRMVLVAWVVLIVAGFTAGGAAMTRLSAEPSASQAIEAARVAAVIDEIDPSATEVIAVLDGVPVAGTTAAASRLRAEVTAAVDQITATDGVLAVHDPYSAEMPTLVSEDGDAGIVRVQIAEGLTPADEEHAVHAVAEVLRGLDAPTVLVGGDALLMEEFETSAERDLQRAEMIALPIAFLVMAVVLGGFRAAGMPLAIAFASVAGAMFVLLAATELMTVSIFAINVISMLGIGLGIDYGLLVVSRFREERAHGADIADAVERTVATAGSTVTFSALTVAVALGGLFAFDDPMLRSFGIAGIGVVLAAMAAALTLLPALLAVAGGRIRPAAVANTDDGRFAALARFVQRRAVAVVAVVSVVLLALASPFLGARFEAGDARSLPRSSETREVALTMADRFPAVGADPITVVAQADPDDERVTTFVEVISTHTDVAAAAVRPDTPAGLTVVDVVPDAQSQSDEAQHLVHLIRDMETGMHLEVGGTAATLIDLKQELTDKAPLAFGVIALATFVLLFLMTGSIAVPIKAIVMNLLSLGASFGALVWIFQDGNLANWLGFEPIGSVDLTMPILVSIFAFGLSMDYEVFLLSRIKEVYDETGDNDTAVAVGLQRSGRIITSAALLIVIVFAGFASSELIGIKQLGIGMALAVIVDATIVRSLLVPATMKLLGDWNWWAPRPLRRLHERFGIHEGGSPAAQLPPAAPAEPVAEPIAA